MSPDRRRMLRAARFALHLITVSLAVVTALRAVVDGTDLLPAMVAAGLFLAWYGAGASMARGRAAHWWLIVLGAVWLGMLALSPEFVWLSFPLLLLAGHVLPVVGSALFAAVVLAAAIAAPAVHSVEMTFAHLAGPLLGGGFALAVSLGYDALLRDAVERDELIASLLRAQREMAELQDELGRTQREAGAARERTRLARDLHDTIAQELSSVSLLARGGDAARMPQIDQLAQHSLTELRRIVAALAPAELQGTALTGALQRLLDALAEDTGISVALDSADAPPALPTPVEVTLLRIAQSALANVRQHSGAEAVRVTLSAAGGRTALQISDDGRGFDTTALEGRTQSYGLVAMRSRLRELGGELRIDSVPGEGTTIRAEVRS
ncbi:sensor histidine kinase [Microbacterium esteraromaticum]|uniref:sensor histidine kinase n=1 Tax=Microbacterium esteraromaticum TaxID=57043 RepID=UPI0015F675F9|nr:sensor histidine kinase [Microbacterium esteraromaticum]